MGDSRESLRRHGRRRLMQAFRTSGINRNLHRIPVANEQGKGRHQVLHFTVRRCRRTTPAMLGIVAIMSLAVAACSSSSTSSSSSSSTASGSAAGSSTGSAQVTAAKSFIAPYLSAPTTIGPTTPLTSKAPSGKTLVNLMCTTSPQCATINAGEAAAAKAVGWKLQTIPFDSTNVATLISGMKTALRYHPVAVSLSGIPQVLWQSEIPAYQAAGVPIIPQQTGPVTTSATVPINEGDDSSVVGNNVGHWVISNSDGKGKALVVDIPDFGYLKEITTSMDSTISAGCAGCTITSLNATIAQQAGNTIVPAVGSALQRDRSIHS